MITVITEWNVNEFTTHLHDFMVAADISLSDDETLKNTLKMENLPA